MQDLPPAIRADVHVHLCAELVTSVPVLQDASPIVVRALVSRLSREVSERRRARLSRGGPLATALATATALGGPPGHCPRVHTHVVHTHPFTQTHTRTHLISGSRTGRRCFQGGGRG